MISKSSSIQEEKFGRSIPSANSQKILWDGLTDFEKIKKEEIEQDRKTSLSNMASVAPTNKIFKKSLSLVDNPDLVPAGLQGKSNAAMVEPNYSLVGESLRHNTPNEMQCSMFCGGRRCKYESGAAWKREEMALKGIYSHWITEDI